MSEITNITGALTFSPVGSDNPTLIVGSGQSIAIGYCSLRRSQSQEYRDSCIFGILSDRQIEYNREDTNIIIEPFNRNQLSATSYNVSLGEYFYRHIASESDHTKISNPSEIDSSIDYWNHLELAKLIENKKFIDIQPGETILGHTNEFVGAHWRITSELRAKSNAILCGIVISASGGVGNIGFVDRWPMVITNISKRIVRLTVGKSYSQILFHRTGDIQNDSYSRGKYKKYNLEELIRNWEPKNLLNSMINI